MPKLIVHHIFSAGVAALILAPSLPALPASVLGVTPIFIPSFVGGFTVPSASLPSWILFVPVYFAATLTDTVIDMFGHHRNSGAPYGTRTWLTHPPYTAPLVGAVVGLGVGMLFTFVSSFLGFGLADYWQWTVAAGIIASFCHLVSGLEYDERPFHHTEDPAQRVGFGQQQPGLVRLSSGRRNLRDRSRATIVEPCARAVVSRLDCRRCSPQDRGRQRSVPSHMTLMTARVDFRGISLPNRRIE